MAIELIQVRVGPCIGRPTYREITPLGTPEALFTEFSETWKRLRGADGQKILANIRALSKKVKGSRRDGTAYRAIMSLGSWEESTEG